MLAHNVYFSLRDASPEATRKLAEDCKKYLSPHDGILFFACGTLSDLNRPVNVRDFDVALHIVFENRAAHDAYQIGDLHHQFIAENESNWVRVRVFDSEVEGT